MGSVSNSSRQDLRCPRGVFAGLLPSIYKILSRLSRYCRILRGLSVIWRNSENSSRTVFAVSRIRSLPPQSPAPISMRFCNTPQTDCGGGRRGDSATVRVLRCSWNRDPARIAAAESRGDAESADSKNSHLLEHARRDSRGQSVRERAVSESSACTSAAFRCFEKNPTFLSSAPFRAYITGKSRISPRAKSALRRQRV